MGNNTDINTKSVSYPNVSKKTTCEYITDNEERE